MRIRMKQKFNLIDNYITIYRILYNCKQLLSSHNEQKDINMKEVSKLCDHTLDLKSKYEDAFTKLKMIDNSFILLKQQLNECKNHLDKPIKTWSIEEICKNLNIIETEYLKLNL